MSESKRDQVECYSGHIYAQEPRIVIWQGDRYPVARIEARWRTPQGPAFRVQAESGDLFDLYYHELEEHWAVANLSGPGASTIDALDTNYGEEKEV